MNRPYNNGFWNVRAKIKERYALCDYLNGIYTNDRESLIVCTLCLTEHHLTGKYDTNRQALSERLWGQVEERFQGLEIFNI